MDFKIHGQHRARLLNFRFLPGIAALWIFLSFLPHTVDAAKFAGTKTRFLDKGVESIEFDTRATEGLTIVSLHPASVNLKLLTASEFKLKENLSAKQWTEQMGLIGAINAGMYQTDYRTSVGLLKTPTYTQNSRLNSYKSVLAFDPVKPGYPAVQIIDRQCQPFDDLKTHYGSLLQGIRMLGCDQKNVWVQDAAKNPMAAVGIDKNNSVLLIFMKKPQTTHDFINLLLDLPLEIRSLMYLEGGPPVQFYLKTEKAEIDLTGGYSNASGKDSIPVRLPIPNVIGIVRKK